MGVLKHKNDLFQIGPRGFDRQPAQSIIASELHDRDARLGGQHFVEPVQSIGGCVAADSRIHHAPREAGAVQVLLQKIRVTVAWLGAVSRCQAVAERDNNGPVGNAGVDRLLLSYLDNRSLTVTAQNRRFRAERVSKR